MLFRVVYLGLESAASPQKFGRNLNFWEESEFFGRNLNFWEGLRLPDYSVSMIPQATLMTSLPVHRFLDTANTFNREAGPSLSKFVVCDNVDLPTILQVYLIMVGMQTCSTVPISCIVGV